MALLLYPKGTYVAFFSSRNSHWREKHRCTVIDSELIVKGKNKYYKYTLEDLDEIELKLFKTEDGENGVRIEQVVDRTAHVLDIDSVKGCVTLVVDDKTYKSLQPKELLDKLKLDSQVRLTMTHFLPRIVKVHA